MNYPLLISFLLFICFIYFLKNPRSAGKFFGKYKFVLVAIAMGGIGYMIYYFDVLQGIKFGQPLTSGEKQSDIKNSDPVKIEDQSIKPVKTYSAKELFKFYNSNNFPKVGNSQTQTKPMNFNVCKETVINTIAGFGGAIPTKEIVNTGSIYMAKVWSNESEILFNCSSTDNQMTVVVSPYL